MTSEKKYCERENEVTHEVLQKGVAYVHASCGYGLRFFPVL